VKWPWKKLVVGTRKRINCKPCRGTGYESKTGRICQDCVGQGFMWVSR
jgi:DnaJ-class molecular chaperone